MALDRASIARLHRNMLAIALANSPSIHGPTRSLAESGFKSSFAQSGQRLLQR